jgi:hypothetical protein
VGAEIPKRPAAGAGVAAPALASATKLIPIPTSVARARWALAVKISRQLDNFFRADEIAYMAGLPGIRLSASLAADQPTGRVKPETLILAIAGYEDAMRDVLPAEPAEPWPVRLAAVRQAMRRVRVASGLRSLGRAGKWLPRQKPLAGPTERERKARKAREATRLRKRAGRDKARAPQPGEPGFSAWNQATPEQRAAAIAADQRHEERDAALLAEYRAGAIDPETFKRRSVEIDLEAISYQPPNDR